MATITVKQVLRTPSLTTERKAWDAVGQLTAKFVALLVKLDADSLDLDPTLPEGGMRPLTSDEIQGVT